MIIIDVRGRVIGGHAPRRRVFANLCGIANIHLMTDRPGLEVAAHAAHSTVGINQTISVQTTNRRITIGIDQLRRAVGPQFMTMLHTPGRVGRPVIGQIVLGFRHTEFVFDIAVAPFLAVVFGGIRNGRNEIDAANVDAHRAAVEGFLLVAEIKR